ncbi:complex I NDUFA9 subunit family protein [Qipengyuania qiaonensis]|uniref:Complex I NDUFA9 subunit family protein n=1 Tax=Qipengyuania qiaonensis TaxID=2867240 RepID=A0ABS7J7I7_9SPHN|nr:complex I NDUFA9 subunit family protein [Qipengyuania qiaonensis]MBX7481588.1 complex I NDUFA9 subunit family protein [Qipengyuania qiaonensis]
MAKSGALNGKLVVLMGGSGFIGNYVAQALLERGARVRIAGRNPEKAFTLKPLANLGQMQFARCDATDRQSVERCITGADAVVNLIGSFTGDLRRLMGEAPGWMAEAAAREGAGAFVHISAIALNTNEDPEIEYAAAKVLGEKRVLAAFPTATILRPSILFGKDDTFINMFAGLISTLPVLPVFAPDAKLQPVYVDDVAEAAVRALENPEKFGGKTYELGGPEQLSMMDINRAIAAAQLRKRSFLPMPDTLSAIFAVLPGTPMSSDQWQLLKAGNVTSGDLPGFDKFGIAPKPLELFLNKWMVRYRKHGRFNEQMSG